MYMYSTHLSPCVVVVQVDEASLQVLASQSLARVDELLGKGDSEAHVLRAARPLEVGRGQCERIWIGVLAFGFWTSFAVVAAAGAQFSECARARHRVRNACRTESVHERRLTST